MTKDTIAKSRTGMYHEAFGPRAAVCNSRTGIVMGRVPQSMVEAASDSSFCKKCFPNGKPTNDKLAKYF